MPKVKSNCLSGKYASLNIRVHLVESMAVTFQKNIHMVEMKQEKGTIILLEYCNSLIRVQQTDKNSGDKL